MTNDILCPFCFKKSRASEVLFRCTNVSCEGKEIDGIYAEYQGQTSARPKMGKVFPPERSNLQKVFGLSNSLREAKCPECKRETSKRICPTCHFELMHDAGTTKENIIAVIGGRSTGKSSYIAVLIQRLKNEVGANFDCAVMAIGDTTRRRYDEDFYQPIFKKGELIQATRGGAVESRTKTPMVFRVTIDSKGKRKAVNLVLFDSAGEDMQTLDSMSAEVRYILYSDAIVFLLDPLQIKAVRQQLPESELPKEISDADPEQIVGRLYELHQRQFEMKSEDKIAKPVAFTLAKVDALFPLIDPSSALHHAGDHLGYLNKSDVRSVHTEISTYLQNWLGLGFNKLVDKHFKNYNYFGISSFGKAPVDGALNSISPLRVEDPILWIFHQIGMIEAKK